MSKHQLSKSGNRPGTVHIVEQQLSYSGPLPPAEQLQKYEDIAPGFAKAILEMAQKAQEHANEMDRQSLQLQRDFTKTHLRYFGRGQIVGGVLALSGIIGGTVVAVSGAATAGAAIISAVMAGLAAAFAWGKWHERSSKNDDKKEG